MGVKTPSMSSVMAFKLPETEASLKVRGSLHYFIHVGSLSQMGQGISPVISLPLVINMYRLLGDCTLIMVCVCSIRATVLLLQFFYLTALYS